MSRRIVLAVSAIVLVAAALALGLERSGSSGQTFAVSGLQRWVVAPIVYICLALCLLTPAAVRRGVEPEHIRMLLRSPVMLLALPLVASTAGELIRGGSEPLDIAQGIALFGGFLLAYIVGSASGRWRGDDRNAVVWLIVLVGVPLMLLGVVPGSLPAFGVPAAAVLIHLGLRSSTHLPVRLALVSIGAGSIARSYILSATSNDPSDGLVLQMWFAAVLTAIAVVPRRIRMPFAGLALLITVVGVAASPIPALSVGVGGDLADLTLAQRAYETTQVFSTIGTDLWNTLLGLGPGGTVDLSQSPDSATLAASGRTLARVTSVHLLTSYVLLKLGVSGVIWLAVLLTWAGVETHAVFARRRPTTFDIAMLCLIWCGVAAALPAATFLFSNVLPPLALGVLRATRLHAEEQQRGRHHLQEPATVASGSTALPR